MWLRRRRSLERDVGSTDAGNGRTFRFRSQSPTCVEERLAAHPGRAITVMLRSGTYYLPLSPTHPGTLHFIAADSGTANAPVTWTNYPGETPIISGGEPIGRGGLGLTWHNVSGSLWQVQLPAAQELSNICSITDSAVCGRGCNPIPPPASATTCVRARVIPPRTRSWLSAEQCSLGTYLRMADTVAPTGANAGCPSASDNSGARPRCLDRFKYSPEDPVTNWANLNPDGSACGGRANAYPKGDIEIAIFESWTMQLDARQLRRYDKPHISSDRQDEGLPQRLQLLRTLAGPALHRRKHARCLRRGAPGGTNRASGFSTVRRPSGHSITWQTKARTRIPIRWSSPKLSPSARIGGSLVSAENLSHVDFPGHHFRSGQFRSRT